MTCEFMRDPKGASALVDPTSASRERLTKERGLDAFKSLLAAAIQLMYLTSQLVAKLATQAGAAKRLEQWGLKKTMQDRVADKDMPEFFAVRDRSRSLRIVVVMPPWANFCRTRSWPPM